MDTELSIWPSALCYDNQMQGGLRRNQKNKYRALWEFAHGVAAPESTPTNLQIAKSNDCNFKCVTCVDHRAGSNVPRTTLDPEIWDSLLELIPQSEMLAFHGVSEFMLDPDFFDIVERCASAKATLSINTNGSVCTQKYKQALLTYPAPLFMNFSMDAVTAETFLRVRGWKFQRVLRNVKAYIDTFRGRTKPTWISLSFVITRSSVHEMVPLVFLANELKVDAVKYYRLHEDTGLDWCVDTMHGGVFDYRAECVKTFADEYNRQISLTREAAEMLGVLIELPAPIEVNT